MSNNAREIEYLNPFATTQKTLVRNRGTVVKRCGKQGLIVKNQAGEYDYLVNGRLVTQRAGCNEQVLMRLVLVVLGSEQPDTHLEQRAKEVYEGQIEIKAE